MKQSNMLAMMFMGVLVMGSFVSAGELTPDFDGANSPSMRSVNLGAKDMPNDSNIPEIPMPKMETQRFTDKDIEAMPRNEQKKLHKQLDLSIKTAVEYCEANRLMDLGNRFKGLLAYGTVKEKYKFVNNSEGVYVFNNEVAGLSRTQNTVSQTKGGVPICQSWGTQRVCVKRETKEKVCTAGVLTCVVGSVIATGGTVAPVCTVGAAVCTFVTVWVDECNDVPYCTQWYTEVI